MIDTISIKISVKNPSGEYIEEEVMNILYSAINNLSYQNNLYFSVSDNCLNVILSYPRYFYFTNAYLISKKEECLEVNNHFITYLRKWIIESTGINSMVYLNYFESNIGIKIIRVDTPFTYYMSAEETFYSYKNVYKILSNIYVYNNSKCNPKNYDRFLNNEIETLILADTPNVRAYNSKIVIYNQFNKMADFYQNNVNTFDQIIKDYPDLQNRIRIEVSKRIRRDYFSPEEFRTFSVFEYVYKFVDYALENMFNSTILNIVVEQQKEKLKFLLLQEKQFNKNFSYENFIYKYVEEIWDYDILRKAIMETSTRSSSGYCACSNVSGILYEMEQKPDGRILFLGVIKRIHNMINYFNQIKRGC